jgi:hypothetical protein
LKPTKSKFTLQEIQIDVNFMRRSRAVRGLSPLFDNTRPWRFLRQLARPFPFSSWVILIHNESPLIMREGNWLTCTSYESCKTWAKDFFYVIFFGDSMDDVATMQHFITWFHTYAIRNRPCILYEAQTVMQC